MDDVAIIIQARMESVRLPGKSLMPISGVTLIERCYQQCLKSKIKKIIVATASTREDKLLYDYLLSKNITVYQGDSDNLVKRYYQVASHYSINHIIRITGDNPLVDPEIINRVWDLYQQSGVAYASTRHWDGKNFTSNLAKGLAVDIFSINSLKIMLSDNINELEREHIVYYFVNNQNRFKIAELKVEQKCPYDLSIDTIEDLHRIEKIINYFEKYNIKFEYSNYCQRIKEVFQ